MLNTDKPPGLIRRLAVIVYDAFLLIAVLFFATIILLPFQQGNAFEPSSWLYSLYLLLVSFLFYAWFWTRGGQTLGLLAWKLRVVNENGLPISWQQAALRFASAWISWGLLGLGLMWMLVNKDRLMWHDLISKTRLVWKRPA
ncbi:MAG: RDD family protein [Cycloclasticus sp.]|nr:RDD family protein [Cycloclasticus sp.]MBQ0788985.1 RDD family protein [Cycloclasticus sp.]